MRCVMSKGRSLVDVALADVFASGEAWAVILGALVGLLASLPSAVLFERALAGNRSVNVAVGLASIMSSFVLLTASLLVVWLWARDEVLVFGCAQAGAFLLLWSVEAWRAWRDAWHGQA